MNEHLLVLCTCPDEDTALALGSRLVDDRLVACINIVPGVTSIYLWKGRRETAQEWLLVGKSHTRTYKALQDTILKHHPYELPEIVAVPIEEGLPAYLSWIDRCLGLDQD